MKECPFADQKNPMGYCEFCIPTAPEKPSHLRLKICKECDGIYPGIFRQKYCGKSCVATNTNKKRTMENNPNFEGSTTTTDGYQLIRINAGKNGYKRRSHIEIEKVIGRPVKKGEVVHHRNGDKKDDRPENLFVFPNLKYHTKYHAKLKKNPNLTPEEFMKNQDDDI